MDTINLSAIIERAENIAELERKAEERRRRLALEAVATRRTWQTCLMADSD
jgi:hypothetical protein